MGTQDRRLNIVRTVENNRLTLQHHLDACKTIEERRKLGQFATPTALARDIVSFGIENMDAPHRIKFFDPAFGTGAFYSALLERADDDIVSAKALEIDPLFANAARDFWNDFNIETQTSQ